MDTAATRAALIRASEAFTLSRRLSQTACPFMNSHRDGECARCVEMHAHDAEIARQWHAQQADS